MNTNNKKQTDDTSESVTHAHKHDSVEVAPHHGVEPSEVIEDEMREMFGADIPE